MKKVLILTGPAGSGKSTIADLLVDKFGFIKIDGDVLDTEFFPDGGQWLTENSQKLEQAHNKILAETKKQFSDGKNNVVLDYIIFGSYLAFFEKFRKVFGDSLEIKILFPSREELVKRDKERECWTAGADHIVRVVREFHDIKDKLGEDYFINTTGQTPDETFQKYFTLEDGYVYAVGK